MCGRPGGGLGPASLGRGGFPASPTATPAGALVPPAERLPLDHPDFDPNPDSAPQGHGAPLQLRLEPTEV
eukprot:scaffold11841_cov109-Isochrysis_galbana.AAC.3